jgi:predicted transcriptional regulator YheO
MQHQRLEATDLICPQRCRIARGGLSNFHKTLIPIPKSTLEEDLVIGALAPVITLALGPMCGWPVEVVLHDLRRPANSVVAIANGHVTGRSGGASLLGGPLKDEGFKAVQAAIDEIDERPYTVIADYTTLTKDGRSLRSATVVLRNAEGRPYAAVCVNSDISVFQALHDQLAQVLSVADDEPANGGPSQPSVDDLMDEIVADALSVAGKPAASATKQEKVRIVAAMDERGLFLVRGGVEQAAQALGVTRFSIYNYLDEIRGRAKAQQRAPAPRVAVED